MIGPLGISGRVPLHQVTLVPSGVKVPEEMRSTDRSALSRMSQNAPVDAPRVAAIRAALGSGAYKIDARAIAERMIAADMPHAE